jgi:hypothetical protein
LKPAKVAKKAAAKAEPKKVEEDDDF